MAEILMRLAKNNARLVWEPEQQLAFETMVNTFMAAPGLRHFNHEMEVIIETDGSDYMSAGVLS